VTAQVNLEQSGAAGPRVTVNQEQLLDVLEQLAALPVPEGSTSELSLGDVLVVPGLVTVASQETLLDEGENAALREAVTAAVDALVEMRSTEGERLARQIIDELGQVTAFANWFEPQLPELRQSLMARARERIADLAERVADSDRVVQEAAILADRADVAEEVVRLRAHLEAFHERLSAGGTVGRTLDFLCQEIHRELNTLGSKCREPGVAERLVDAKSAAERVREQVQNLE
jgi:uncharacterized protein (TIGR00255 family)